MQWSTENDKPRDASLVVALAGERPADREMPLRR